MLVGVTPQLSSKDALMAFIAEATGETPFLVTCRDDQRRHTRGGRQRGRKKKKLFFIEIAHRTREETIAALLGRGVARQVLPVRTLDGEAPRESTIELVVVPDMATGKLEPRIEVIGYIGPFVHQHLAIESFLSGSMSRPSLMEVMADPALSQSGDYADRAINTYINPQFGYAPINPSQRVAVESLAQSLEIVQGPPGTLCLPLCLLARFAHTCFAHSIGKLREKSSAICLA